MTCTFTVLFIFSRTFWKMFTWMYSYTACIYTGHIKRHGQSSGLSSTHKKQEKIRINICRQTSSFLGTSPTFFRPKSFIFYLWWHLIPLCVSSSNWKWRDASRTHFYAVKPFTLTAGPSKLCDGLWCDVRLRALIHVEDILGIFFLWELNGYRTGNEYCKCIVSVVRKILHSFA